MDNAQDSAQNNHVVEESNSHPTTSSLVFAPPIVPPGHVKMTVRVLSNEIASQIIGTAAAKLRCLQEETATIIISPFRSDEPIFTIIGLSDNVRKVKTVIEYLAQCYSKPEINDHKPKTLKFVKEHIVCKFSLPSFLGLIFLGQSGVELIRYVESLTQTLILQPSNEADPSVFKIIGKPECVTNALQLLNEVTTINAASLKAINSIKEKLQTLRQGAARCIQRETSNLKEIGLKNVPNVKCIDQTTTVKSTTPNTTSIGTTEQVTTAPQNITQNKFNSAERSAEMKVKFSITFLEEVDDQLKYYLLKVSSLDLLYDVFGSHAIAEIENEVVYLSIILSTYEKIVVRSKELKTLCS